MKKVSLPIALAFCLSTVFFMTNPNISSADSPPYNLEKVSENTYVGVLRSSEKTGGYYVENGYKVPIRIASKKDLSYLVNKKVKMIFDGEITKFKIKSLTGTGDSTIYYQGYIPPSEKIGKDGDSEGGSLPSSGAPLVILLSAGIALLFAFLIQSGSLRHIRRNPFFATE